MELASLSRTIDFKISDFVAVFKKDDLLVYFINSIYETSLNFSNSLKSSKIDSSSLSLSPLKIEKSFILSMLICYFSKFLEIIELELLILLLLLFDLFNLNLILLF